MANCAVESETCSVIELSAETEATSDLPGNTPKLPSTKELLIEMPVFAKTTKGSAVPKYIVVNLSVRVVGETEGEYVGVHVG